MFPGYGLRFGQGHAWPGPSFRKVNRNFIDYTEKVNIILLFAIITQVILFWQMYTVTINGRNKPEKMEVMKTMAKSRLIGSYPVIGIRPTIDGRRGALDVRGSLEEQTMNMAKNAAKLFEENLKYSNGEPVKVVIADSTIGRVGEAA